MQIMKNFFDKSVPEPIVINNLKKIQFKKIGEGSSAHVFGDTGMNVVLKIFPPLDV